MKKYSIKIKYLLIVLSLNIALIFGVGRVLAFHFDIETSNQNSFTAGILDFSLLSSSENFIPLEIATNMRPGDSVTREISVISNGNPFQYRIQTIKIFGDDDFCNSLKLEAKLENETKYSNGLMNLNIEPPIVIGSDNQDDWLFTITLPSNASVLPGKICQIKFVFEGWQTRFSEFGGFLDREEILSFFVAGGIKINKVYYDVDSAHGIEEENEWIEIYNPLEHPVDISGWQIEDNISQDIIPVSDPIPPYGFAIISGSDSTWDYWEIPSDVVKIVLEDGKIGNGLSNESDRVILRMPDGTENDAVSWGEDNYAFDPPCPDVAEGHILGRVPTGYDTNQASDWKDLSLPSVTVLVPNGGEVWWIGRTYTLKWTATNPNGDDGLLSIDIWYSRDSGATWANIVRGIYNDGAYKWRIPLSINGYYIPSDNARIKVVATGPENFIISAWDMSDRDFCPPIDYDLLSEEELRLLEELGLIGALTNEGITAEETINENSEEVTSIEKEIPTEDITEDESTTEEKLTVEETPTDEEEISTMEEEISVEETNETSGEIIEEIIEEIVEETADETTNEETTETTNEINETNEEIVDSDETGETDEVSEMGGEESGANSGEDDLTQIQTGQEAADLDNDSLGNQSGEVSGDDPSVNSGDDSDNNSSDGQQSGNSADSGDVESNHSNDFGDSTGDTSGDTFGTESGNSEDGQTSGAPTTSEETATMLDDSSFSIQDGFRESGSDGGSGGGEDTSSSSDGSSPTEGIGESSGGRDVDASSESVSE